MLTALLVTAGGAAQDQPGGTGWGASASAFRGQNGAHYVFTCPFYGTAGSVWGTDVYTDDSSVCTAAVHAGLITLAGGGSVTIEIRPGQSSYTGSTRNGITSSSYGVWSGSYAIVAATRGNRGVGTGGSDWSASAAAFRTFTGARFAYTCPANGTPGQIWGTDVYTDDSSVCSAAVHAGVISPATGGSVTIEMREGQSAYTGSTRNGVTSAEYGPWYGSGAVTVNGTPLPAARSPSTRPST
jgi:LCCL domain